MSNQPIRTPQPATTVKTKWWASSITVWGSIITALTTVIPTLGAALGLDVRADTVQLAGEQLMSALQAIGGLAGTAMAIYGRFRATKQLEL